jgi:hypothetical protein
MGASSVRNARLFWEELYSRNWPMLAIATILAVAGVLAVFEASLGLRPGFGLALAIGFVVFLVWSAFGVRAAVAEPELRHWLRLLESADVKGVTAVVEVEDSTGSARGRQRHPTAMLANVLADAHLHTVGSPRPLASDSCESVIVGPGISRLDASTRLSVLDDSIQALRPGGHLFLVVPAQERRAWRLFSEPIWHPGAPGGWWSEPLTERLEEVRYAVMSPKFDAVLGRRVAA